MTEAVWWRAKLSVSTRVASFDETGDYTFHDRIKPLVDVIYQSFPVLRHTPCGVWLSGTYDWLGNTQEERFVLRRGRKRWACPTKEEALESLKARSERRRRILSAQVRNLDAGLRALKSGDFTAHDDLMSFDLEDVW